MSSTSPAHLVQMQPIVDADFRPSSSVPSFHRHTRRPGAFAFVMLAEQDDWSTGRVHDSAECIKCPDPCWDAGNLCSKLPKASKSDRVSMLGIPLRFVPSGHLTPPKKVRQTTLARPVPRRLLIARLEIYSTGAEDAHS